MLEGGRKVSSVFACGKKLFIDQKIQGMIQSGGYVLQSDRHASSLDLLNVCKLCK